MKKYNKNINNLEENSNNNIEINEKTALRNKSIIIVAVVMVALIIAQVVYAYFSDSKDAEANLRIGEIEVILVEDWPEHFGDPYGDGTEEDPTPETYDEFGIKKYTKEVWGESVAELDAYVRIRCIPIVQYYKPAEGEEEAKWITAPVSQDNIRLEVNTDDNWIKQGDYWYYKNILEGNKDPEAAHNTTEKVNMNWKVLELPSELSSYQIRTDVRVILEYAQTTNNMWKDIFQIDDLPEGVERVE